MFRFIVLLCLVLPISAWSQTSSLQQYSFGVVPQQSAKRLAQLWSPIFNHIHQQTGIRLRFATAKNIPAFEKKLAEGAYDFAYMNPYHFTVFNQAPGYKAVAVRDKQPIRGIVVVRKDSPLKSLSDLEGQRLAFPSPAAFAASVLPRAELNKQNINYEKKYVSSHDSVYLNVAKGLFAAGGGVNRTLNNTPAEIRDQLKILWKTEAYTPHAIAANPNIDSAVHEKIAEAFSQMHTTEKGKKLLQSLKIKHQFIVADDAQWDDVRSLGIDLLNRLITE